MKSFIDLTQSRDLRIYQSLLEKIFGQHSDLFPWEIPKTLMSGNTSVPETPSSSSTLKKANADVAISKVFSQSSGSTLPPELELGVQTALSDLVSHNMLDLRDVADAESYLPTSTWASSIFLQEEDKEKRSAMIIASRKNEEKRRRMGGM